ncbi:DUF1365 domain-containing protein [Marinicella sediminis]|uniref:DUF1365 domain-containing protein n=1 Tax=Marinicella sediminis TaxID=1792834 RepID=A0ABV7JF96_9GAMM|nr:DUF1365 domain-containing protein [Marinicella sediminis]
MSEDVQQNGSANLLPQGFADGTVIHHRMHPKRHRFKYHMNWCIMDVDDLSFWTNSSRQWRHNRWGVFAIKDQDYIDDQPLPIGHKVREYIKQQTGQPFNGRIQLFTHPRFLGFGFNSVNFYFCQLAGQMRYIISEINNTPWGEKHLYFHDCQQAEITGQNWTFAFSKAFHISPFMSMDIDYQWQFEVTAEAIVVRMSLHQKGVKLMQVLLDTKITPAVENSIKRHVLKRPFQPWKMAAGIYWQALKLWLKRIPFIAHPERH